MKSRHGGKADVPKGYDPTRYPKPAVTADVVVFTVRNERLEALLIKRKRKPCAGLWAIPGGFVEINESLEDAAQRELFEETGIKGIRVEQLAAYGDPGRDPRDRIITIAFMACAPANKLKERAGDDAAEAAWFDAYDLPPLAFDHDRIMCDAIERLRKNILETPLAVEFCAPCFSMAELKNVYNAVLGEKMSVGKIKRRMAGFGKIVPCPASSGKRVYRFKP